MYQDKLRGFVGLRATLVIKVQVNSQPFQQGRLMLQYIPYAQYMPNRVDIINSTLQGRSGCPRTDLDLSVGTECEMRIPYVSPHTYYNLITGQGSFGSIYLVVYSPLVDKVANGIVEYTVWAHLEDVDIQFPTAAPLYMGSAPNQHSLANRLTDGSCTVSDLEKAIANKTFSKGADKIFAQMSSELQQLADLKQPSRAAGFVSSTFTKMREIPVLGNIFSRPAWIAQTTENLLRVAGFSKPTVAGLPCESKLRTQARMANFDGADTSHKLAMSCENELETISGLAGTNKDEMDISTVVSIPNYWDRFTWGTANDTNAVLWYNLVTPMKIKNYSATIADRFRTTHMGYVANCFSYWRGGIVYTFKFVKTKFHSGRLSIAFIPYCYNPNTSGLDMSRAQKMVVDLRTSTEVSFTVPYVSTRPWMLCSRPETLSAASKAYAGSTGIVMVTVLNKLVAASTVSENIDVIVEVSGASDLQFAGLTSSSYAPYTGDFVNIKDKLTKEHEEEYSNETHREKRDLYERTPAPYGAIFTQMMGENVVIQRNDAQNGSDPTVISQVTVTQNLTPEALCIGERTSSIRQLIKRFGYKEACVTSNVNSTMALAPFGLDQVGQKASPSNGHSSLMEYFAFLYGFYRGSVRYKILPIANATDPRKEKGYYSIDNFSSYCDDLAAISSKLTNANPTVLDTFYSEGGQSKVIVDPNIEGVAEVEYPYYSMAHISPITFNKASSPQYDNNDALRGFYPPMLSTIKYLNHPDGNVKHNYYKAAGDDFSYFYLLGVPPLINRYRVKPN
ncbi:MAG: capsid protein [Guiyang dicistrovirus 2]|nr:MAG: capsid protein [Guiyang dicistrovirus 2]